MYTVKLLHRAELDFADACEWYEEKQSGLGLRFFNAVSDKFDLIRKNPLHYNIRFSEIYRFAPINDFPYLIIFRIDEKKKLIYVISVFHTSRNPAKFS